MLSARPAAPAWSAPVPARILLALVGGLLAAWLVAPAFAPVPSEGFGAALPSIALHLAHDTVAAFDPGHPFNTEYFALSRPGANLFVAGLVGPLGLSPDRAMRVMMHLGLALLAGSSLVLVRRWAGASLVLAAATLTILLPGPLETAFAYNDNILSAGLGAAALALLSWRADWPRTAAAGLVFGLAVLVRLDAVLLAPAAALVVWEQERALARFLARGAAMAAIAFGVLAAGLAPFGVTPLALPLVAREAVALWARGLSIQEQARSTLYFLGPAGLALGAVGAAGLARDRAWLRLALLAGIPLLYSGTLFGKLWQPRQLVLLTPFLAALTAAGARRILEPGELPRAARAALAAAIALAFVAPPVGWIMSDGPHAFLGRLWSPVQWLDWQAATRRDQARVDAFVDAFPAGRTSLVVTDTWNDERYLHLALQSHGFRPEPARAGDRCAPFGQAFSLRDRRVVHLKPQPPFLKDWPARIVARWDAHLAACLSMAEAPALYFVAPVDEVSVLIGPDAPKGRWDAEASADRMGEGLLRVGLPDPRVMVDLSPTTLARLREGYGRRARAYFDRRDGEAAWRARAGDEAALLAPRTPLGRKAP